MAGSNRIIEEIKSAANIVDVIGKVVPLKRAGSNYKGCCPFHNEKTASFVVSESKQIFTCFGCEATGDVIEFTKRYYNLDFKEAIEKLGKEYGIDVEFKAGKDADRTKLLYEINREAAAFFMRALFTPGNKGYKYICGRGLKPETLKAFGIGYADSEWHSLRDYMRSKGYKDKDLINLGLLAQKNGNVYDKYRNRIIFPIINTSGKVIGFGGRIIGDGEPKYLNSDESPIFQKKNNLYALNLSRKFAGEQDCAILVEGYMDVVSLFQSGVKNVAASLGTALTENQAKLLKRYTKNIVLSYDADNAGRKAALRGIEILHKEDCNVKVLHVSDGKDPDEFVKKNGPEAFRKEVASALNYAEYRLDDVKRKFPPDTDEGRLEYMKAAANVIRSLSPVEQDIYIKKVAGEQGLSEGALRREVDITKPQPEYENRNADKAEKNKENTNTDITGIERQLIKILAVEPSYYNEIAKRKHVFASTAGGNIFEGIYNQLGTQSDGEELDVKALADGLSSEDAEILRSIIDNEPVAGNEEKILHQCFNTIARMDLEKRRNELNVRLDMLDNTESSADEKAKEIIEEIMYLNEEIAKIKRNF